MSAETWTLQYSKKLPNGDLINVRGEDSVELEIRLASFPVGAAVEFSAAYDAALNAAPLLVPQATPTATTSAPAAAAPQGEPAGAAPSGRSCHHGALVERTGTGKRGPWRGYFCPSPKGTPDQCSPQFVN